MQCYWASCSEWGQTYYDDEHTHYDGFYLDFIGPVCINKIHDILNCIENKTQPRKETVIGLTFQVNPRQHKEEVNKVLSLNSCPACKKSNNKDLACSIINGIEYVAEQRNIKLQFIQDMYSKIYNAKPGESMKMIFMLLRVSKWK